MLDDVHNSLVGVDDEMTVMGEDLSVGLSKTIVLGKKNLPWSSSALQFVNDVVLEEAKIRILNAGQICVTYQAALKGLT